jgi:succinate dehydrogenase / fumarate reductase flavoprotein subunit
MKIFPAVHYSMGGLWADYTKCPDSGGLKACAPNNHMTNIPGLYAIGEAEYQYHGANRLGANSLLSCIFEGLFTAPSIESYMNSLKTTAADMQQTVFDAAVRKHKDHMDSLVSRTGDENAYKLHDELGRTMTENCTVVRYNDKIKKTIEKIDEISERYKRAPLADTGNWTNQNLSFTRALGDMLVLGKVIALGALQRDESRGAHYKPDFTIDGLDPDSKEDLTEQARRWCREFQANNDKWLKTTVATHTPSGPKLTYEDVDTSSIPPRPRTYGLKGAEEIMRVWNSEFSRASAKEPVTVGV